jgi:hypothetical protein
MEENEMESKLIKLTRFSSSCDNIMFDTCAFIHFWIFLAWPRQNAKFWLKVVAGTITPDMSLAGDIATGDRHFNRTFNLSRPEGSAQPCPSPLIGVCFFSFVSGVFGIGSWNRFILWSGQAWIQVGRAVKALRSDQSRRTGNH